MKRDGVQEGMQEVCPRCFEVGGLQFGADWVAAGMPPERHSATSAWCGSCSWEGEVEELDSVLACATPDDRRELALCMARKREGML